ncbi:THUMP-like domain-containing protein [Porphyromonas endodontalis]
MLTLEEIERIMNLAKGEWRDKSPDRILFGKSSLSPTLRQHLALQISYREKIAHKYPSLSSLGIFLPEGITYEQSSGEATARYKADTFAPAPFLVDGTGGLGIDFSHLARRAQRAIYLERNEDFATAAQYNIPRIMGESYSPARIEIQQGSLLDELERLVANGMEMLYFDPARRAQGGARTYALADTEPSPIEVCHTLQRLDYQGRILIKVSPMEDIKEVLRQLPTVGEIHIVQSGDEVKELLLYIRMLSTQSEATPPSLIAVQLSPEGIVVNRFCGTPAEESEQTPHFASALGHYLLLPGAALQKSGLYQSIGIAYNALPLHPNSHIYTTDQKPSHFLGKCYEVVRVIPAKSSELKRLHQVYPEADFSQRNFPLKPIDFYKKTKIRLGSSYRLIGTTLLSGESVIIEVR